MGGNKLKLGLQPKLHGSPTTPERNREIDTRQRLPYSLPAKIEPLCPEFTFGDFYCRKLSAFSRLLAAWGLNRRSNLLSADG